MSHKMFLEGKMIIYFNHSDEQFRRDPQLLKMLQFEKVDSVHLKTVVRHLKVKFASKI